MFGVGKSGEIEYLEWNPEGSPVYIHMNPGVADGIAHDVIEGSGIEVGGLLLGRVVAAPHAAVWIERYQRISCDHRSGPEFILDSGEIAGLETAAANILASGELAVVGLYRSHTRPGFQLEEPDFDLIRRHVGEPGPAAKPRVWRDPGVQNRDPDGREVGIRRRRRRRSVVDPDRRTGRATPPAWCGA